MRSASCCSSRFMLNSTNNVSSTRRSGSYPRLSGCSGARGASALAKQPDRDGQYFHYLAMWLYALSVLARHVPAYRDKGVNLVRQIHDAFVVPGRGVIWKMKEDLSAPYPGYGLGALDAFDGYVSYRCLDEHASAREICRHARR